MSRTPRTTTALFAATLLSATLLTACGGSDAGAPAADSPATGTSAAPPAESNATVYPLTVDNCGTEVTFDQAPQRVVTIKSATTEMLLALGVGDRIVATAYPDGPAPEPYTAQAAALPVLSDRVPGNEAVLDTEPALVYAGWESNFSADGAGERASFEQLGVRTFVAPSACKEPEYRPDPLTFDLVFDEIEQVGQIMDVASAATELVTAQQASLAAIEPDDRGLTALWFSSGSDIPYVGGNLGAPALIMTTAGLENIAAEIDDSWGPFGWEQVAAADPDVLVLVDSEWNSAEKKIELLESTPLTAELTAVRNRAYVIVPFPATEAGVRTVDAAADVATQVKALPIG
ncbi:MAG: putative F420-0 ABC transporter substrate-binding protein [Cellulomonadaceae bacterium]